MTIKYHLVHWHVVCMPKSCRGLGILDLKVMNKCLFMKWLWTLENYEGMWQELLYRKYLSNQHLTALVGRRGIDSQFWQGLMKVKDTFASLTRLVVAGDAKTLSSEDVWLWEKETWCALPRIFNITLTKQVTVKFVKDSGWGCFSFRRCLHGEYWERWEELKKFVHEMELCDKKIKWSNCWIVKKNSTLNKDKERLECQWVHLCGTKESVDHRML